MSSSSPTSQTSGTAHGLGFDSYNEAASETILLLHAMGTSRREWDLILPHLSDAYHVLVVDMPGHSASGSPVANAGCLSIPAQADTIRKLIESHAHGGMVHLAGVSMGGFVAVEIARRHPDAVLSVFSSGAAPYEGFRLWAANHASWMGAYDKATAAVTPQWLSSWKADKMHSMQSLQVSEALKRDMKENDSPELMIEFFGSIAQGFTMEGMREVKVRTLTVAGGRMDAVEATRKQGRELRKGCSESRAVVVKSAWHLWDLQLPELFARSLKAWIEKRKLPEEMQVLDFGS